MLAANNSTILRTLTLRTVVEAWPSFAKVDMGESRVTRFASGLGEIAGGIISAIPLVGAPVVALVASVNDDLAKLAGEKTSTAAARITGWSLIQGAAVAVSLYSLNPTATLIVGGISALPSITKGGFKAVTALIGRNCEPPARGASAA